MTHPRIRTGRSLVGLILVLLGLSTYGCGDTGTATQPAELGGLSVSPGDLQPPFSPAVTSYTVQLPTDVSSTTITATPRVSGDTIRIDNQQISSQTVTLDSPGAEKSVNIVVTETGTGGTSKSYSVQVKRASLAGNNSLASLTVSPGTLAPEFENSSTRYTVSVGNTIGSVTITPTLSDPAATMTVNGQPALSGQPRTIDLNGGGQTTTITTTITALNGSTQSYTVDVSRGPSNNNNLRGLVISSGSLNPDFRAGTTGYTVNVGSGVDSVRVRPTVADSTATLTVNGQAVTSGQQSQAITLSGPGSSTVISIIVIAQNGTPKPYSVNVVRAALGGNNNLSALTVSPGDLAPTFSVNTTNYTADVTSSVSSVTVTPTRQDPNATITVNGQAATSGQGRAITLNGAGSDTSINIVVTAPNSTQKIYTVNVHRAALGGNNNLQSLTVTPGALNPTFNANTLNYTVDVNSDATSLTVTPRLRDSAASLQVNGQVATSGQPQSVTLNGPGSSTIINILAIAQNGNQKTYSINVNRAVPSSDNNLSALRVRVGNVTQTLTPSFDANTLAYTVNVPANVDSVRVTATKADSNAGISGDLPNSGQATIQLDGPGTSRVVSIIVTAPNGTQKSYAINITRAAASSDNNLSALSLSGGNLTPVFAPDTLAYSMDVTSDISSVTVAATKADPNAVISGDLPNNGQATIQLDGPGTSKVVSIIVIAANGIQKAYAITINRAAPVAKPLPPGTAPDLLEADDSCPPLLGSTLCAPGTSNTDNVTNVRRPRFTIPPPTAGTPSLYVGTTKYTFAPGTTTLRPSVDLADGSHTITYTLTNAGGESDPSPPLDVTIDSTAPVR
ncbi:MAG TPA: cadherin-like beta sandwich domain-containing protein [Nitrospira sp.]|nr:cadherin-like beta sandwich domain-containing protein [Nitrospira sp.]